MRWEYFTFEEELWYCWHIAGARIYVCRNGKTWQGYCSSLKWGSRENYVSGPENEEPVLPAALMTDILGKKTAALKPCFPEKPFLISLEKLKLFPGMKTKLSLKLPPNFCLVSEKGGGVIERIFDFSPFELKETWHGSNTMNGILCYSLPLNSGCDTDIDVHCSMAIINRTKTVLTPEKIILRASELSIYEKDGKLLCDMPVISAGENDFRMEVKTINDENAVPVSHFNKLNPNLIRKGKHIIKNITGF